ncbi:MAG: ATP-binding protein [Myxococcales bacterium]|nr:ATP-binding protein [Myxococcales bacterium]
MSEPAELRVSDALDKLIHQFSDPLSFFREVIQNALDAGSQEVEVYLTYEEGKSARDKGVAIIHIDDWGEGMTREIIEKRLTRLFSSSKDGDRTKIGKFGIGFVSVFAIEPEIVCVDTSREGEHWRVLFTADRKFELRRLEVPVDGTKIRIYKRVDRPGYEDLVRRSRDVIRYWCKHTRGEIRFEGDLISEPLDVDATIRVREEDEQTTIVVGHPSDRRSFFGFYNRGLTLLEGDKEHHPGLAFKISSDLLEHTLTRDNVIQDRGYYRVLERLQALIRGPLSAAVFAALEKALVDGHLPRSGLDYLYKAAAWHLGDTADQPAEVMARRVATTPSGQPITLGALKEAMGRSERPLVARERSPLSDAVEATRRMVILAAEDDPLQRLIAHLDGGKRLETVGERFCMPLPPRDDLEASRLRPLAEAADRLLRAQGGKLSGVAFGRFAYPGSPIADNVAITQLRFGALDEVGEVRELGSGFLARRRVLVINADHPTVHTLIALAQREPELAAYVLAKLFYLGRRLDPAVDGELARLAHEHRDLRLGAS